MDTKLTSLCLDDAELAALGEAVLEGLGDIGEETRCKYEIKNIHGLVAPRTDPFGVF